MKLEGFKKAINVLQDSIEFEDTLAKVGVDISESIMINSIAELFELFIDTTFKESGSELIFQRLFGVSSKLTDEDIEMLFMELENHRI